MNNEIMSSKQAISTVILYVIGSTLVIGGSSMPKQDSWISMILGYIIVLPLIFVYARILQLYPEKNLFEIIIEIFGNVIGKIFVILFTFYALHLGGLVFRNFSEFVQVTSMPETPQFVTILLLGLLCIYIVKSGLNTFGKWCLIATPILCFVVLMTVILGFKDFQFSNLLPVYVQNKNVIPKAAFSNFTFPFGETILFTTILSVVRPKYKIYKVYYLGITIAAIVIIAGIFRNILLLGVTSYSTSYYPSFDAARLISIGDFLTRIEGTISANFLLAVFVKISVCLFAASKGITKIFDIDNYKKMVLPCSLIMITICLIVYKNAMEMFEWISVYKYYALPFQVALPLLILVVAEYKNRKNNPYKQSTAKSIKP